MLQYLPSGSTTTTFWRSTRSFIVLAREWCGPDGEDICDNFELTDDEMYDIDYVMEQFELYCEPICSFHAARYKFHQVSQRENEINAFYHRT